MDIQAVAALYNLFGDFIWSWSRRAVKTNSNSMQEIAMLREWKFVELRKTHDTSSRWTRKLSFVCSRVVGLFVYTLHFLFLSVSRPMWQTVYVSECRRWVMKLSHISRVAKLPQFNDLFWDNTRAFAPHMRPFDNTMSDKGDVMHNNEYEYAIHRRQWIFMWFFPRIFHHLDFNRIRRVLHTRALKTPSNEFDDGILISSVAL